MKKQRKKLLKIILLFLVVFQITTYCYASQEEILQTQSDMLNIKGFVSQANNYTQDVFEDMDVGTLLNDAIGGKIDNQTLISKILNLFGKEVKETIKIIRKCNCHYYYT